MKYERFEDLPVWQAAADMAAKLLIWTAQSWFRGKGDLAHQLQRSALSISNNIAEGFERGTTSELLHFLYVARGSAGEVRSMLGVMDRVLAEEAAAVISDLKSPVSDMTHFKFQISNRNVKASRGRFEAGRTVCKTRTSRGSGISTTDRGRHSSSDSDGRPSKRNSKWQTKKPVESVRQSVSLARTNLLRIGMRLPRSEI